MIISHSFCDKPTSREQLIIMSNDNSIPLWDPSNWDWLNNNSAGDSGEASVLSCDHPWRSIDFLESIDVLGQVALGCSICGEVWEENSIELLTTIWQAAKEQLYSTEERLLGLEEVVSKNLNLVKCFTCGKWLNKELAFDLTVHFSCYNHIASSVVNPAFEPTPLLKVLEYVKQINIYKNTNLSKRAHYENMVTNCNFIASALEEEDFNYELFPIDLTDSMIHLGLPSLTSLNMIITTLARKCDFNIPSGRSGKAYILNIYNLACKIKENQILLSDVDAEIEKILPTYEALRVSISVQICFPEVEEETQFSGDMAEEALMLTSKRIINVLIK